MRICSPACSHCVSSELLICDAEGMGLGAGAGGCCCVLPNATPAPITTAAVPAVMRRLCARLVCSMVATLVWAWRTPMLVNRKSAYSRALVRCAWTPQLA